MSAYSERKFKELSEERQLRVMLDLILKTEAIWDDDSQREKNIDLFSHYFSWFDFYTKNQQMLQKISHLEFKINSEMSLRNLLNIAVPIERYLNLAVKDEHIFQVKEGDGDPLKRQTIPLVFILDHLRSAFNVGSLFRTAECLGVEHIYLVGYTPTPEDSGVRKTAMGTEEIVSWSSHNHLPEVIEQLKSSGRKIVALETAKGSTALTQFKAPKTMAFVVGNERFGLKESDLELVDECVEIPMLGAKNSLNVANSLSIASFEVLRQWKK